VGGTVTATGVVENQVRRTIMTSRLARIVVPLIAVALSSATLAAQRPSFPIVDMGPPDAQLPGAFDHVTALCELADERVVLLDSIARTLSVVDFNLQTREFIGREGDGPGEYRLPVRLIAAQGYACAMVDLSRTRVLQGIARDGQFGTAVSLQGTVENRGPNFPLYGDTLGHVYGAVRGEADSVSIVRWLMSPWMRDTVGKVSSLPVSTLSVARGTHEPPPYTTYDTWTVSPDGWLAFVSAEPYAVAVLAPDGRRATGPAIIESRERVTAAHRADWRRTHDRPLTRYVVEQSGLRAVVSRVPWTEPARWPDVLPAFLGGAVSFASDGSIWVLRAGLTTQPQRVDVFGRDGVRQRAILLPPASRVVGHGRKAVYVAIRDADDLERLARFDIP